MPVTQVIVNVVIKKVPIMQAPCVTKWLQDRPVVSETLSDLLSQLPCMGLTDTKYVNVIKKMGRDKGESQGAQSSGVEIFS